MDSQYLLLVKNAQREFLWYVAAKDQRIVNQRTTEESEKIGRQLAYSKAEHLAKTLEANAGRVVEIRYTHERVSEQTAAIFALVLRTRGLFKGEIEPWDASTSHASYVRPGSIEQNCQQLEKKDDPCPKEVQAYRGHLSLSQPGYYMVVGHQGLLTSIARCVLGSSLPTGILPLGSSEIACIRYDCHKRLLWILSSKSEKEMKELLDKIKSKYDVAKFFLGAFIVNTGIILSKDLWKVDRGINSIFGWLAIFFTVASLLLTTFTLFSYDELLMPRDFWGGITISASSRWARLKSKLFCTSGDFPKWSIQCPPSQRQLITYYEMVHVWQKFFIPALTTAFLAIACSVMAIAYYGHFDLGSFLMSDDLDLLWIILITVMILLIVWSLLRYYQRNRPVLGVND